MSIDVAVIFVLEKTSFSLSTKTATIIISSKRVAQPPKKFLISDF
jgi:hypothetical protein